ncbi:unnamed protein product, partial [Prorocentrum cordatum]
VVKWKDVRGPIAAVQAALLQIGWDPQRADMTTVQIELNRLAAKSKFDEWAADIAVISGGQWTS